MAKANLSMINHNIREKYKKTNTNTLYNFHIIPMFSLMINKFLLADTRQLSEEVSFGFLAHAVPTMQKVPN